MHRFHVRAALTVAAAALALAACGSSSKPASSGSTPTTAAPATEAPPTTAAAAEKATVAVAMNAKIGHKILVDSDGMTLYVWDNDKTAGTSRCTGQCAAAWPPLKATGTPTYGAGLTASMFSTIAGDQLAVNGKPLYRWVNDKKVGDATGQGVNGFYVVGVDGKKIDSD
jgi:predicted lipoprotein with Yx(FWY)xxD motif